MDRNTAPLLSASGRLFMIVVRLFMITVRALESFDSSFNWSSIINALSRKRSDKYSSTSVPSSYASRFPPCTTFRTNWSAR